MIWIALTVGYVLFLALVWGACVLASRADDLADDSADWLGVGSDSFPHNGAQ